MFDIKVQDFNGKTIDIAIEMRFANDLIEVTIDEDEAIIKELAAKDEFIYLTVSNPGNMLGQSKIMELEISIVETKDSYYASVNAIKPGR